jgi:hypothetical protein
MLCLAFLFANSLPRIVAAADSAIAIQWDPHQTNQRSAAIWLGYLMARAVYRDEHKLPLPASGKIVPSFKEEISARTAAAQIYQELKAKDKGLHDSYWEILSLVKDKGFMDAYVWTYLRRSEWQSKEKPKSLLAFQEWSRVPLQGHKPQTYGSLAVEGK